MVKIVVPRQKQGRAFAYRFGCVVSERVRAGSWRGREAPAEAAAAALPEIDRVHRRLSMTVQRLPALHRYTYPSQQRVDSSFHQAAMCEFSGKWGIAAGSEQSKPTLSYWPSVQRAFGPCNYMNVP